MLANGAAIAIAEFAAQFGNGDCSPGAEAPTLRGGTLQSLAGSETGGDHSPRGSTDEVLAVLQLQIACVLKPRQYAGEPSVCLTATAAEDEDVRERHHMPQRRGAGVCDNVRMYGDG